MVVVNDGSTRWPDAPSLNDSRVQLVATENRGVSAARNLGKRMARGKYLAFQDADDFLEPDFLKKLTDVLQADNALTGAYCDANLVWMYQTEGQNQELIHGPTENLFHELTKRPMSLWSMVLRSEDCRDVWFDTSVSSASEDWDFLLRLSKGRRWHYVAEKLVNYRQTKESMSKRFERLYQLTDHMLERHYLSDGPGHLTSKELQSARYHLRNWVVREMRAQGRLEPAPDFHQRVRKLLWARKELWFWYLVRKFRP